MKLREIREKYIIRSFVNLYSPPSIIRMSKSSRMRWAGHVARMGKEEECI
jgi:hypothetical protein